MNPRFGDERITHRAYEHPPTRGGWYDLADIGCAGLSVGLAVATVRLFSNTDGVLLLVAVGLGSWVLASMLRRSPLPGWAADLVHLGIGAFALMVLAAPSQRWSFLPTPASVQTIVTAVRHDFAGFDKDVAPLVAGLGHLVVMSVLLGILALFNSTSAMRLRSPVQGAVPHVVAFVGLGFVAREPGRITASVAMFVALGIYGVTQVAWRNAAYTWVPKGAQVAARSLALGFGIVALAGLVTAVAAPLLPGGSEPVVNLRRGGLGNNGPRTVVSPFVEVGTNLGPRSDELLFDVETDTPQYWRVTALDSYDAGKSIWVLSNTYTPVDEELRPGTRQTGRDTLKVSGLGGIWIPTPDDAVTARAPFGLNWDDDAESLIRRSGDLEPGDAISIGTAGTSGSDIDLEALRSASPADDHGELVDPTGAPPDLVELARSTARERTPYEGLLALQNYFHDNFTYDESVDLSGAQNPLEAFLALERGFCQQFSTAFALGARSLGYPARVVVGFTPGDEVIQDQRSSENERTTPVFAVRGRHAHAWPEVRFEGVGWVPFEPTPGRGNPATSEITGIAAAQAPPPTTEPTNEPGPSTVEPVPEPTTTPQTVPTLPNADEQVTGAQREPSSSRAVWPGALGGFALLVIVAAASLTARRRAARRPVSDPNPIAEQWRLATNLLVERGLIRSAHETPSEFARRCDAQLELPTMIDLAEVETMFLWSPLPTSDSDVATAVAAHDAIAQRLEELDGSKPSAAVPTP